MRFNRDDEGSILNHVYAAVVAIENAYKHHPKQKSNWLRIARNQLVQAQFHMDDVLEHRDEEQEVKQGQKDELVNKGVKTFK